MAFPLLLLVTILLGLVATTTLTVVFWRSVSLRIASLILVSVHLALRGVLLLAPPRVPPALIPRVVTL